MAPDALWMAIMHYKQRDHVACATICAELLSGQPTDQAAFLLRCRALSAKSWCDDSELENEGMADLIFDDNAVNAVPRPGTSIVRLAPGKSSSLDCVRPVSSLGRPLTGFATPGSASRPISGREEVSRVLHSSYAREPSQSRSVTSFGPAIRLGTTSLASKSEGDFSNLEHLDFTTLIRHVAIAKAVCDYLIYHKQNLGRALEICVEITEKGAVSGNDWWWKCRLGRCYYRLGLYRDAERQLMSSLQSQTMAATVLELSKIYMRIDQPNTALDVLKKA